MARGQGTRCRSFLQELVRPRHQERVADQIELSILKIR